MPSGVHLVNPKPALSLVANQWQRQAWLGVAQVGAQMMATPPAPAPQPANHVCVNTPRIAERGPQWRSELQVGSFD